MTGLTPHRLSAATRCLFDTLADGNWHPYEATFNAVAAAAARHDPAASRTYAVKDITRHGRRVPDDDAVLIAAGARLIAENTIRVHSRSRDGRRPNIEIDTSESPTGAGRARTVRNAMRFATPDLAAQWRAACAPPPPPKPKPKPKRRKSEPITEKTFAGLTESQGWALAPLRPIDQMSWKSDPFPVDTAYLAELLPDGARLRWVSASTYYLQCPAGTLDSVEEIVTQACAFQDRPTSVKDVKRQRGIARRDLADLPPAWLDGMLTHYTAIGVGRVINKRRAAFQVIAPREYAEGTGALHDWVRSVVTEHTVALFEQFDAERTKSFGAYFVPKVLHEFDEFARSTAGFGRHATDIERKIRTARTEILTARGVDPDDVPESRDGISAEDYAEHFGVTVKQARDWLAAIANARALRSTGSIHAETHGEEDSKSLADYALPDPDADVDAALHDAVDLAAATRMLIEAAAPARNGSPNLLGMTAVVRQHMLDQSRTRIAADLGTTQRNVAAHATQMEDALVAVRAARSTG